LSRWLNIPLKILVPVCLNFSFSQNIQFCKNITLIFGFRLYDFSFFRKFVFGTVGFSIAYNVLGIAEGGDF
jgi:hypothetical protein